ncbi:MAG: ATP synthase F1 subunit epsilon [Clostridiales bacterium]|nr:ATP synthase F1 subunit epsilon [Candidatus Blautia equi]
MKTFLLKIGTPDGLMFEGQVERVVCRSITGDMAILAGHCNFCTALGMGEAHIVLPDGTRRSAACIGGMLSMMNGECSLMATTWEWEENIDADRAAAAKKKAEDRIASKKLDEREQKLAEAKLKRALVRLSVKG